MKKFEQFLKDESGATAIEYGLLAALISVGIIAGASTIGSGIRTLFTDTNSELVKAATASE
ncbi:Flp family type IVb pilin [Litorimonas sp. WD9-15]|uniref:Flp family type IVb pilin n=1 Tax=Litorimonas sp. WD9-15 TaxID=3418716 RepID=UPI003CFE818C